LGEAKPSWLGVENGLFAGRKGRMGRIIGGFCRQIKRKIFVADLDDPVNYFLGNFLCRGLSLNLLHGDNQII
jgi:hypothetical protein